MQATYRECLTAHAALQQLAKIPALFETRLTCARLLRVVGAVAQEFATARTAAYQSIAKVDDKQQRKGLRNPQGAAVYDVDPTDELMMQENIERTLEDMQQLDVEPLTLKDFPAKLGKDDNTVTPDILAGLGPFLDWEG